MSRWNYPLDPNCREAQDFIAGLYDDPMTAAMGAPVDDILEDFERRHRASCSQCQEYGAANAEVV
jgi:hypothetical protein